MDHKRNKSKLSMKRRDSGDLFPDENQPTTSTPIRPNARSEDEESPSLPFLLTQEMREDVDVLWDYNSPQSKPRSAVFKRSKKRLNLQQSPKVPLIRHPSNNNEHFCKLREKLQALKDELAKPPHEESLILSPREEEVFKTQTHIEEHFEFDQRLDMFESECEDPFDDDMDAQLVLFSQQIEEKIEQNVNKQENELFDDSFDLVLSQIELDKPGKTELVRSHSEDVIDLPVTPAKVEWHRTRSFENFANAQEIERKRLEAKAKLQRNAVIPEINSPSKCSLDEIEKKRQQARAKLEAKKQQEIIEKKKQEAIRRREESRKKNVLQVKSLLGT